MASATHLSTNDNAVLGALFDPESSLSNSTQVDNTLPTGFDAERLRTIQQRERQALLPLNTEQPSESAILGSISQLDQLIQQEPTYASTWSNRAQTRRMLHDIEVLHEHIEALKEIMEDLSKAIDLATPANPLLPVPAINAKVLASAHTHRGYLLYTASKSNELAKALAEVSPRFDSLEKDGLEELASHDFTLGGRYGNDTARQLAVRTNPYAKLCGSIVKEAMQKEVKDYNLQIRGIGSALQV